MSPESTNIIWQILNSELAIPIKDVEAIAKAKQEFKGLAEGLSASAPPEPPEE